MSDPGAESTPRVTPKRPRRKRSKRKTPPAPPVVNFEAATTAQVAAAFGMTVEAIHHWRKDILAEAGIWWEIAGDGRGGKGICWHLPKLIDWKARRMADVMATRAEAKALGPLEEEQLRKIKRENDEREGRLVNKAELVKQWSRVGADMRQELESVGRRHGTAVANDIAHALAKLQRGVHGVMGDKP